MCAMQSRLCVDNGTPLFQGATAEAVTEDAATEGAATATENAANEDEAEVVIETGSKSDSTDRDNEYVDLGYLEEGDIVMVTEDKRR